MQPTSWPRLVRDLITALLIIFFLHSVIDNSVRIQSLQNVLAFYTNAKISAAWAVLVTEIVITILLFLPRTRLAGLAASLLFIIIYTWAVFQFPHAPHRFGGLTNYLYRKHYLLFELSFAGLVLCAITISLTRVYTNHTKVIIAQ